MSTTVFTGPEAEDGFVYTPCFTARNGKKYGILNGLARVRFLNLSLRILGNQKILR